MVVLMAPAVTNPTPIPAPTTNGVTSLTNGLATMKRKLPETKFASLSTPSIPATATSNGTLSDDGSLAFKKYKSDSSFESSIASSNSQPVQNGSVSSAHRVTDQKPETDSSPAVDTQSSSSDIAELKRQLQVEDANLLLLKKLRASQTRPQQLAAAAAVAQRDAAATAVSANTQLTPTSTAAQRVNLTPEQQLQHEKLLQLQRLAQIKQRANGVNQSPQTLPNNAQQRPQTVANAQIVVSTGGNVVGAKLPPNVVPAGALFRGAPPPTTGGVNQTGTVAPSPANTPAVAPKPQIRPPDPQAAAKREQAAKLALKKQLEKTLLQIPPPRPPPSNLDFLPWPTIEFLYLVGLDETVNKVLIDTRVKQNSENIVPEPFQCHQCQSDFTTVWKQDQDTGKIICEQCLVNNNKKAVKKEHTNRLKLAVENALQQEKEIIQKLKDEERKNAVSAAQAAAAAAQQARAQQPQQTIQSVTVNSTHNPQMASRQITPNHHQTQVINHANFIAASMPTKGRILNPAPAPPTRGIRRL